MSIGKSPEEAALTYARVGWPVFPCREGSKEPAARNGFHDATTDERQIRDWWKREPDRNVAIATGKPGPDVVDVDVHKEGTGYAAFNWAKQAGLVDGYNAVIRTPSRGMHLYYEGTEQRSGRLPERHLDFRSQGGYIVAPPSSTPDGSYEVIKHSPATGATVSWDQITKFLTPEAEHPRQPVRQPDADGTSLDRLAAWVSKRHEGDRNFPLFYAAKQAHLAAQLDHEGIERLVDASLQSGLRGGEREARRTIASAQRSADREARPFARQREREAG
jgi:hypothetical protein